MEYPKIPRLDVPNKTINRYWRGGLLEEAGKYADDSTLLRAIMKHEEIVDDWKKLDDLRATYDSRITPAAHFERANKAADKLIRKVSKSHQEVTSMIDARISEVQTEINQRLKLKDSPQASEIRKALLALEAKERLKAINDAIRDIDGEVMQAVFTGRKLLTGVDEDTKALLIEKAEETHATDLKDFMKVLEKVKGLFDRTLDVSLTLAMRAGGTQEQKDKFAKEAKAADEAILAFNESVM